MRRLRALAAAVALLATGFASGAAVSSLAATPPTDRSTLDAICGSLAADGYSCSSPTTSTSTTTSTTAAPTTTTSTTAPPPATVNSLARILYEMDGPHEGPLHGIPSSYSWCCHPTVDDVSPPSGFTSATAWGLVYADANASEPAGVRVELKNMELYVHSRSHGWIRVQGTVQVDGAHYVENFAGNSSIAADWRTEPDGGISSALIAGYNLHFWPTGSRASLPVSDIDAAYSTVDARLIGVTSGAKYLGSAGGDWWLNPTAPYDQGENNPGIGQGRFAYLSGSWQAFDFWTGGAYATIPPGWTDAQMSSSPPPIDAMGHP